MSDEGQVGSDAIVRWSRGCVLGVWMARVVERTKECYASFGLRGGGDWGLPGGEDSHQDDERNIGEKRDGCHDSTPEAPRSCVCGRFMNTAQHMNNDKDAPCSTCGSSSVTAFSVSVPPTCRVRGMGISEAIHHRGKRMKPM